MRDSDWQILYELYQTPSITKVANKLFITQPALSKRLQAIESEFQIQVVNRSSKGIEFTEEGKILARNAEAFMGLMDNVKKQLREIQEKDDVIITIGVPYTFGLYVLEKLLIPYSKENPKVHFEMVNGSSDRLFDKVVNGNVDLSFIRGDFNSPVVYRKKVHTCQAYVLTKDPVSIDDLPNMQRITYKSNEKTQSLINSWWYERFRSPIPDGISGGDYLDMACNIAATGLGYVCCFQSDDSGMVHSLEKTPMLYLDGSPVTRNTWYCYKKSDSISRGVLKFIEYIENNPDFQG